MTTLSDALAELGRTRAELLAAISGLDEAALDRKGVIGEWSIKNVLAHIAAWEAWVVEALPARMATGATPAGFPAARAGRRSLQRRGGGRARGADAR